MDNAFMASTKKHRQEQEMIEGAKSSHADPEELVAISVRIPKALHRLARLHSVETGESVTTLVRRLLTSELVRGGNEK